ncbi:MAG: hypothetical protein IPL53_17765 [Ignavibacteria bacterium]|nr:hypothetical protein [Ignavibacteria bacterium]
MEKSDNKDDVFFHIINFANDPELWEKRKEIINKDIAIDFKKKEFIEKHLSENFKNLINDQKLIISLGNFIGYAPYPFLSPNFPNFILAFGLLKEIYSVIITFNLKLN